MTLFEDTILAVIKTFSTDEGIYKDFKKTCVDNEESMSKILTEFMRKYLKESKIPISEKLEIKLKESNSNDLEYFADPELWIQHFSSYSEQDMEKFARRRDFFRWLFLVQQEKIQKETGNIISQRLNFESSDEDKALKKYKIKKEGEEIQQREKRVNGMCDPMSEYYIEQKENQF